MGIKEYAGIAVGFLLIFVMPVALIAAMLMGVK